MVRGSSLVLVAIVVAGCSFAKSPQTGGIPLNDKTKFSQSRYGVAASPRLVRTRNVPKGGGRRQIGKPYQVAGKWYFPKADETYNKVGQASWYGPNFHGRMTANGEIYDQFALSAAHPTLPLPSYARVTNIENGKSVIVRINDRGPFHGRRIIDLSARAAELLDYQQKGTAEVRVEYVGEAPLHGRDASYLEASYRESGQWLGVAYAPVNLPMPGSIRSAFNVGR